MKKLIFISILLISTQAFALLPTPPVLRDEPISEQQYLQELYNNHNVLTVTTTAPNGNRLGKKGEIVIYNNKIWYNTTGLKVWVEL